MFLGRPFLQVTEVITESTRNRTAFRRTHRAAVKLPIFPGSFFGPSLYPIVLFGIAA
jgi:hypothetical protein